MALKKSRQHYPKDLGARIRLVRTDKGMKLVELAKVAGVTASSISQIERSRMSPTVATLKRIASALGRPLGDFFTAPGKNETPMINDDVEKIPVHPVVHKHQRKLLSPGKGITFQLLNPDMSGPIEFIYNIYEPGAGTGSELYSHPGVECGLILEGNLLVTIRDREYLLEEGDSITFEASKPHSKRNPGTGPCICVWANCPPWF